MLHHYDPDMIVISLGGILVQGLADDFVNVEFDEDAFTAESGADGLVVRTRNQNQMATITLTLQASSPTNDLLSTLANADRLPFTIAAGVRSFQMKNLLGTDLLSAAEAWVQKQAPVAYGKEHGDREWVIRCAKLNVLVGGAVST